MRAGPVFLDSGIFIAFLDRSDHYHHAAAQLFAAPPTPMAHVDGGRVGDERVVPARLGEEAARTCRQALDELPRLELLMLDGEHHRAVSHKLDQLRGHKLTYVDASTLVFLEQQRIREVWGTDQDLAIEGARVVPLVTAAGASRR